MNATHRGCSELDRRRQPRRYRHVRSAHGALIVAFVLIAGVASQNGYAAEEEHHGAAGEGDGGGHHHKNHFALFLGATQGEDHHGERDDPHFTVGIDYERRLTKILGVGFLADVVTGGNREFLLGIPVFVHAGEHAIFQLAPGWHKVEEGQKTGTVLRTGFLWKFTVGKGSLYPSIFYDISEEENLWVLGLSIGRGW